MSEDDDRRLLAKIMLTGEALYCNDPKFYKLVRMLADAFNRHDFTPAELLGAIPAAAKLAKAREEYAAMHGL